MTDFSFDVNIRSSDKKPFIILYGGAGLGKTTTASEAPDPLFLQTEQGEGEMQLKTLKDGLITSYDEFMAALRYVYMNPDVCKTLVTDSIDHLEPLVLEHTLQTNGWDTLQDGAYGVGYQALESNWKKLIDAMVKINRDKDITIVAIAHSVVREVNEPMVDPYQSHELKLAKKATALWKESSDMIGLIHTPITVDIKSGKAKGGNSPTLFTRPNAAYVAKSRYNAMPGMIPLKKGESWDCFAQYIPTLAS